MDDFLIHSVPVSYRNCVIHLSIDGSSCFTVMPRRKLEARTWPRLRELIDQELAHATN